MVVKEVSAGEEEMVLVVVAVVRGVVSGPRGDVGSASESSQAIFVVQASLHGVLLVRLLLVSRIGSS